MGIADSFKALSDPMRREILVYLRQGRCSAGGLADHLDMAPSKLSYHLAILKKADLILEYRDKNFIYYEVNTSLLDELMLWFRQFQEEGTT